MTINYTENLGLKNPDTNEYFKTNEIYNYNNNIIDEFAGSTDSSSKYSPAPVAAISTNGVSYVANIPEWQGLSKADITGILFTVIPNAASTTNNPTLAISSLSETAGNSIIVNSGLDSGSYNTPGLATSIRPNIPLLVWYDGTRFRTASIGDRPEGGTWVNNPWSGNAIQNTFMLRDRTNLPLNSNLDTVITAGNYIVNSDANARNVINLPKGAYYAFILTVGYGAGTNQYPYQILQDRYGTSWVRSGGSNAVGGNNWIMVSDAGSAIIGQSYLVSDLNTLNEQGSFDCLSNSSNLPVAQRGRLYVTRKVSVFSSNSSNLGISQRFEVANSLDKYERQSNDSGETWSAWQKVITRAEIESLESRIAALESA